VRLGEVSAGGVRRVEEGRGEDRKSKHRTVRR